jgi:hypothetical protein
MHSTISPIDRTLERFLQFKAKQFDLDTTDKAAVAKRLKSREWSTGIVDWLIDGKIVIRLIPKIVDSDTMDFRLMLTDELPDGKLISLDGKKLILNTN